MSRKPYVEKNLPADVSPLKLKEYVHEDVACGPEKAGGLEKAYSSLFACNKSGKTDINVEKFRRAKTCFQRRLSAMGQFHASNESMATQRRGHINPMLLSRKYAFDCLGVLNGKQGKFVNDTEALINQISAEATGKFRPELVTIRQAINDHLAGNPELVIEAPPRTAGHAEAAPRSPPPPPSDDLLDALDSANKELQTKLGEVKRLAPKFGTKETNASQQALSRKLYELKLANDTAKILMSTADAKSRTLKDALRSLYVIKVTEIGAIIHLSNVEFEKLLARTGKYRTMATEGKMTVNDTANTVDAENDGKAAGGAGAGAYLHSVTASTIPTTEPEIQRNIRSLFPVLESLLKAEKEYDTVRIEALLNEITSLIKRLRKPSHEATEFINRIKDDINSFVVNCLIKYEEETYSKLTDVVEVLKAEIIAPESGSSDTTKIQKLETDIASIIESFQKHLLFPYNLLRKNYQIDKEKYLDLNELLKAIERRETQIDIMSTFFFKLGGKSDLIPPELNRNTTAEGGSRRRRTRRNRRRVTRKGPRRHRRNTRRRN